MSVLAKVQEYYPQAFLANDMSFSEIQDKVREATASTGKIHYAYLLAGDGKVYILGEGSGSRIKPFPKQETDIGGNGHIKAGIGALVNILKQNLEFIIVPVENKEQGKAAESRLKRAFDFHEVSVKDMSQQLFKERLLQLKNELPANIFEKYFIDNPAIDILFTIMQDPTGNDYATIKKIIYDIDKRYPGSIKALNAFFRGHFKELDSTDVDPRQQRLFERLVKYFFNVDL